MQATSTSDVNGRIVVSVIFDDPLVRAGVAAILGVQSAFALINEQVVSGVGCEASWQRALPEVDVVVADYNSALVICAWLRKDASRRMSRVKVMTISHRVGESEILHALAQGIHGYLPFGCRLEEMAEAVVALHGGQRYLERSIARRVAESFDHEALTSREADVLRLVVAGYANKMVAKDLDIAMGTVKSHIKSILNKLGVRTRTEATAVALRRGLCDMALPVLTPADAPHSDASGRAAIPSGSAAG
ncbi:LuxR C-terminal-related transcriptional regulator [Variovorax saccharolyticus]|uniref:LuxR C-terminal-related transcriptional regulator n=1 Tax=Variovorax saccharolyticus TaxID=3053516 RepID=UPI002576E41D|nr:response regulator transcription factor [Variovorax sp. J31P216]MDM0028812.1 response regulator transcription factor [Variovorax sp. J31P216]